VTPVVRVVIPTYNAKALLLVCLESISSAEWPKERLETVVVDNASTDDTVEAIRDRFPWVHVIECRRNLGFAGAVNRGLENLADVDYVLLLNNDVQVDPGWIHGLVEVLESDPSLGAATSKVLFAGTFTEVELEFPDLTGSQDFDARRRGVKIGGVRVDGVDEWRSTQFVAGFFDPEEDVGRHVPYRWITRHARLRTREGRAEILLSSERPTAAVARSEDVEAELSVGSEPRWFELPRGAPRMDVINNVGSMLVIGGFGADRGYLEADRGQYDEVEEVFAWSGTSALLRRAYVEDVGPLDDRLFAYYEDLDLSWRGRALGWRFVYVPRSVVRHLHAATSVEGSALFQHYVERNRLIVHVKNAPLGYAAKAVVGSLRETALYVRRDVARPLLERRRPTTVFVRRRLRAFGGFLAQLPRALSTRFRLRRRQLVPDDELLRWVGRTGCPFRPVGSVKRGVPTHDER
jgi:O-antigen biosynthesis protein